jgi:hypothetical protein
MRVFITCLLVILASTPLYADVELSTDAMDFIQAECPAIKVKLSYLNEKQKEQLLRQITDWTARMFPNDLTGNQCDEREVRKAVENELLRLDKEKNWEARIPKLSAAQERVRAFYTENMKISFGDSYLASSWLNQLDIEKSLASPSQLQSDFEKYRVIRLRNLVNTPSPKLIIGCGDQSHGYRRNRVFLSPEKLLLLTLRNRAQ